MARSVFLTAARSAAFGSTVVVGAAVVVVVLAVVGGDEEVSGEADFDPPPEHAATLSAITAAVARISRHMVDTSRLSGLNVHARRLR
jgi:hypothetical protein